ncbi:MAG: dienelactone hydrolase family protein [Chloroflexota bacterium]
MSDIRVLGTTNRGTAVVDDLEFRGPDGLDVEAYLVRPAELGDRSTAGAADRPGPGLLMWHWLDTEAPDGNRTQYLDEAAELASAGVVSLLPQGRFPWHIAPDNAAADAAEIRAETARLRAGLDLLAARPDVDAGRLGVVGHDFGGMLAAVAAAGETRVRAIVIVAATPRWGDWFLRFWRIADDRIDYLRELRPLDPIERIGDGGPAAVLCQFAERDFYIAPMTGLELHRAAPPGSELSWYDTGHDMRLAEIRADRRAFLARTLGFEAQTGNPVGADAATGGQAATT